MKEKSINYNMIIVILIILIVIVIGVTAVLYVTTDLMKPKDDLFKKYLSQSVLYSSKLLDVNTQTQLIDWLIEKDYSDSNEVQLKYKEKQNDEEEVYTLLEKGTINNTNDNKYRRISINYQNENLLRAETLVQDKKYGLRLVGLADKFATVENKNLSYFMSSLGFDGEYFSEQLKKVKFSDLFNFTNEEINTLAQYYEKIIFEDINKKNYSSQRNAIITLNTGESLTTNSYSLVLNQTEYERICKKIIGAASEDKIILAKIKKIDERIKEAGINEPEGKSLEERYIQKLKEIYDSLEYKGESDNKIFLTVYEIEGTTIRTVLKSEKNGKTYILDIDDLQNCGMSLKVKELTESGEKEKLYSFLKESNNQDEKITFSFKDENQNLKMAFNETLKDKAIELNFDSQYSNKDIHSLKLEVRSTVSEEKVENIGAQFDENNIVLLNDYDGDRVISMLSELKNSFISSLSTTQSKINTKLLNSILVWIDDKQKAEEKKEEESIELNKQKFNNQFVLYEGKELSHEHVKKFLTILENNMGGYEVLDSNRIRLYIKEGEKNEEKIKEIENIVTNKYKYNVTMNYSEEGLITSVDISIFKKQ